MQIELTYLEELPDGSASCTIAMDSEGLRFLVNLGLVTAIKESMDKNKEIQPYEPSNNEVSGC